MILLTLLGRDEMGLRDAGVLMGCLVAAKHAAGFVMPPLRSPCSLEYHHRVRTSQDGGRGVLRAGLGEEQFADDGHFFRLKKGYMEFGARDLVELVMSEEPENLNRYITSSPERIVLATWDRDLVDQQAQDTFRLTTRPVQFVTLNLQPCIDIKVWREDKILRIQSVGCRIYGVEHILGQKFADSLTVDVQGRLRAVPELRPSGGVAVRLVGEVVFFTAGQLPRLLAMTPRPILESAAFTVNKRIMGYAKNRFISNLADDYSLWVAEANKREQAPTPTLVQ